MKRRANKIISLILALSLMLSMLAVNMFVTANTEPDVWDGWTTTAPVDSDGDGIYEINNGAELAFVIKNGGMGRSYVLTADIYLNDVSKVNWLTGAVESGYTVKTWYGDWAVTAFQGTIDGAGHTVNGLYYEKEEGKSYTNYCGGVGLIPKASNVTIMNLAVDNSYLHQEASTSAFVAAAPAGAVVNMDSCYAGENVFLKAANVGALRGFASNAGGGSFVNCYSLATLSATNDSGLLGYNYDNGKDVLVIKNCYNAKGAISTMADTWYYGNVQGCYETAASGFNEGNTLLTTEQMQGENALNNMSTLNNYGNYYVATETYPTLSVFKGIEVKEVWNGSASKPTQVDAKGNILINNAKELAYVISTGGAARTNYKLTADIYLNKIDKINWATGEALDGYVPNAWYDNVAFQGNIDGAGHVVYGLYYAPVGSYAWGMQGKGLIPKVSANTTASIQRLGIDNAYVDAVNGGSAFVGFVGTSSGETAYVNIDQCYVGEEVTIIAHMAGAFAGGSRACDVRVSNSYSLATINSKESQDLSVDFVPSGFLGNNDNSSIYVNNCFNAKGTFYGWWKQDIYNNSKHNYATNYDVVKDTGVEAMYATMIDAENMKGLDVFTNKEKMPNLNSTGKFVAEEGYPTLVAFLGYEINVDEAVWDGTTSAPTNTDANGNVLISTAEEFAYIIENGGGANYKLTNDIYLNATDYINWSTGEVTRGYAPNSWFYNAPFSGNIDGNGYTVYGLYYNVPGETVWAYQGVGLIPRVNDGTSVTIKNLAVDNAYISATHGVSAFVGIAAPTSHQEESEYANVTIESCYAGKDVTIIGNHAGVFRGASFRANTTITNCYTLATAYSPTAHNGIEDDKIAGKSEGAEGIFGNEWASTVTLKNVYNANGGVGGQSYAESGKTFTNVYATNRFAGESGISREYATELFTVLTPNNMKGRDALVSVQKLYNLNANNAFEATDSYPILIAFIKDVVDAPESDDAVKVWNGTDVEPTNVDKEGNVLINSAEEFAYIIENGGNADTTYKLTTNIYLNDVDKINWETGKPQGDYVPNAWYENTAFQGTIDGDGYIVYGLYSNIADTAYTWGFWGQGLVPRVECGTTVTIKNLGVDKAYINATNAGGAFVGFAGARNSDGADSKANVVIQQCFVGETVSLNAYTAGAFVGGGYITNVDIRNAYSFAEINSVEKDKNNNSVDFAPSGFIGNNWNVDVSINNSYNANGTLFGWWESSESAVSKNNYATGYDIVKAAGVEAYHATMVDASNMQGLDVFVSDEKMWRLNADSVYTATKGYPELTIFIQRGNTDSIRIWDGTTMKPANGSGTKYEPYLINYASELAYVISSGGAADTYYKLNADIYLNNIYMIDWATGEAVEGYTPNNWYENVAFQGHIDGNGFVVYGLYYDDGTGENFENLPQNVNGPDFGYYYNSGLIPRVNDGTSVSITNLGIDNAYVHSIQGASAFVGFAGVPSAKDPGTWAQVNIDNCYAGAKVYLEGGDTGVFRGGARGANTVVTNSYSLANTYGVKYDGLIGNFWSASATFTNVYNANGPVTTEAASGIVASNVYTTSNESEVEDVTVLNASQMVGANALDVMNGLDANTFTAVHDYYPVLTSFAKDTLVKGNRLYYKASLSGSLDYYATESGNQYFWRYDNILVNEDNSMDISDLVLLTLQLNAGTAKADIDGDGNSTTNDVVILRKALIGNADYVYSPMYSVGEYTPVTSLSADYQYVWGDEFDGDTLNTQKWGIYAKMEGSSIYKDEEGNELGDYTGDVVNSKDERAIAVEDGNLRLTAYKTEDGKYVTPTSVVTQNTMNFKYGYVEIRAKFPVQDGVWSSWWTKSVFDKSDTYNLIKSPTDVGAEIDMIEVFHKDEATFNIIKWWENGDGTHSSWYPNDEHNAKKQKIESDRYYVFGYEWTEDEVIMYCDGVEYGRYDISEPYTEKIPGRNYNKDESGTDMECFDAHQYLIFNNHLFYPSVSDASTWVSDNLDFTQADYLIDYCRVYQKVGEGDIVTK